MKAYFYGAACAGRCHSAAPFSIHSVIVAATSVEGSQHV
jgi:hypothetical protein